MIRVFIWRATGSHGRFKQDSVTIGPAFLSGFRVTAVWRWG